MTLLTKVFLILLITGLGTFVKAEDQTQKPYNVLFIMADDLNDYLSSYGGHPQAQTPFLDKLAKSGTVFTNAHCNYPACVPSRNSLIHGLYPHNSSSAWMPWTQNKKFKENKTMMAFFKENGYKVIGTGKIDHYKNPNEWSLFFNKPDYGPFWHQDGKSVAHPKVPQPFRDIGPVDGSFGSIQSAFSGKGQNNWHHAPSRWKGPSKKIVKDSELGWMTPDRKNAKLIRDLLIGNQKGLSEPFFLSVGFIRPHTPLHVDQEHFDAFPLNQIKLNLIKKGDEKDTHLKDLVDRQTNKGYRYHKAITESYQSPQEGLKAFLQAYLASVRALDANIGLVLSALENSPYRDRTLVVMTSDHGWQMGEKSWLFKGSPWEESTRVPLVVRAPGLTQNGTRCHTPVSLVDIYPTLSDLCELQGSTVHSPNGKPLDGHSLRPLLKEPKKGKWDGPNAALTLVRSTSFQKGDESSNHFSLRSMRFRYIRYSNGQEELYDHKNDPNEWQNLAENESFNEERKVLQKELTKITGFNFSFKD